MKNETMKSRWSGNYIGQFIPITPAGTPLVSLAGKTEKEAWEKLLKQAAHMPYKTVEKFKARGYTVEKWNK